MIERYLRREGFVTRSAANGEAMRAVLSRTKIDLVILDLMLPGEDGLDLTRYLRSAHDGIGIIMLTAKSDEVDRVIGLELGADDYIAKPFSLREVLARVKSVMRRLPRPVLASGTAPQVLRFDKWTMDLKRRRLVSVDGVEAKLTPREFSLLLSFATHANRVLTREMLIEMTRGFGADLLDRAIDVQINRLRLKIEEDPHQPTIIKTVRGSGYVFAPQLTN